MIRPPHVVTGALAVLAVRVAFGMHGFSLPRWHEVIDHSRFREVLIGAPPSIRSDDWTIILPMVFSQRAHKPAFPVVNDLIGDGQSMITHYTVPVVHPITLFRPQVWGYFVGADIGLAWHWGVLVTGLFLAWFWLFLVIAPGRTVVAAVGATLLLVSPFVQFWSLNNAPALAFTATWCCATVAFVRSTRAVATAGWGLLATWSALGLFFYLYPPYTIPLAFLSLTIVVGCLASDPPPFARFGLKLGVGLVLAAVTLVIVMRWWEDGQAALRMTLATEYPGHRFATGGAYDLVALLRHDLLLPLWLTDWSPLGNICEAASAAFLFPLVAAATIVSWLARRTRPDALGLSLLGFVALAVFWMTGAPHPELASWTPLRFVPSTRMFGALVPADVALAVWFVAAGADVRPDARAARGVLAGWGTLLGWVGWLTHRTVPDARLRYVLPAVAVVVVIGHLLLQQRWQALAGLAVLSGVATLGFNPVAHGGSRFLLDNALSRRIVAIDRQWGGGTSWLVWNDSALANLPRALGVRSWNGAHVYPQKRLWQVLDPDGEHRAVWNRYANVEFELAPDARTVSITSPRADGIVVSIAPTNPAIRVLGVTHAIIDGGTDPPPGSIAGLRPLGRLGRHRLYQLADGPTFGTLQSPH